MTAIAFKLQNKKSDPAQQAMDRALRYLSYRPRSADEIKTRLKQYGYQSAIITRTVKRLQSTGLIDDSAFACQWKESRQNSSPRSARLLAQELRQKGISTKIIATTLSDIDDEAEACRAAAKKASSLKGTDINQFQKKMGVFLRHRGFDYEVTKTVTKKLWQDNFEEVLDE